MIKYNKLNPMIKNYITLAVLTSSCIIGSGCRSGDTQEVFAPEKPVIVKTGTIVMDIVEVHYFHWKGRLLREEWCRERYQGEKKFKETHIAIRDVETGELISSLARNHAFGTILIEGDTAYVLATYDKLDDARRTRVNLFTSKDLKTWTKSNVIDDPKFMICNTSLIKVKDEYVLMFEIGKPNVMSWTARFAKSKDLKSWEILPPNYIHGKDYMAAPHCLKYHDGYYYNFHVRAEHGYSTFVSRSKDLQEWEDSPFNPVLVASKEDRTISTTIHHDVFSEKDVERILNAENKNNSDFDVFEHEGKCLISYSWGDQSGIEHLATARYDGPLANFLEGWFPASPAATSKSVASGNSDIRNEKSLDCAPSGLLCDLLSNPELTFISSRIPNFGWIVPTNTQKSYQILVVSSKDLLDENKGDFWNSEKINSNQSINIVYKGNPLQSNSSYWWKVKMWDGTDKPTNWSESQKFNTSQFEANTDKSWPGERKIFEQFDNNGEPYWTYEDRHPIQFRGNAPTRMVANDTMIFYDFGKAAFAYLELNLTWNNKQKDSTKVVVNLGEKAIGNSIDKKPGGGIISEQYSLTIEKGTHNYILKIPRYSSDYPHSQKLPENMPEVVPFRYCEIIIGSEKFSVNKIEQKALTYHHNTEASYFSSSNEKLNAVYNLCKYSTIANTFNGDYANSQRERMMYEADCYIQQMSHYALDREYKIQRYSTENLFFHATWPTEWIMHSVFMAYADYLHTGNTDLIEKYYPVLKAKSLVALTTKNGLISTLTDLHTREFLNSIYFTGESLHDIVDWPHGKLQRAPQGFGDGGETDNFEFETFNSVVNAFHYRCLIVMSEMAKATGKVEDAKFFTKRANNFKKIFNDYFLNKNGLYIDGIGSKHSSIHANLFPLAFGIVPERNRPKVVKYIKSKGMATGVYGANYLMEALYIAGEGDYALELLTAETDRSWMHMIEVGSTMTTEAWDLKYMPEYYGWSHAWSASPAHIIPRKLMGIEPLEAGFGKISIKPQPGNLTFAKVKLPTIRGDVLVDFETQEGKHFYLNIMIPGNTTGRVFIPVISEKYDVLMDGEMIIAERLGNYCMVDNVSSGKHSFSIINTQ